MSNKSIVHSKMPNAGLGNKLFCWAHGVIFAQTNNLPHVTSGLTKFKIGPILRFEKSWRIYINIFKSKYQFKKSKAFFAKRTVQALEYKNCIAKIDSTIATEFVFNEVPHWNDYFLHLRENRNFIIDAFKKELSDNIVKRWNQKSAIDIGVHIRLGDFRKLQANENFAKVGATRTPLEYFIALINQIRAVSGKDLNVTIFSDGSKEELLPILALPNCNIAEVDSDLLQMLHLSKSKIIILSASSTFGQWSAFLSNAVVINHYQHCHSKIRNTTQYNHYYEGVIDPDKGIVDVDLLQQIKSI